MRCLLLVPCLLSLFCPVPLALWLRLPHVNKLRCVPAQPLQREPTVCWTPSPLCAGPHILRSTPWEVCQTHPRILCPICTCHSGMQVVCSLTSRSLLSYSLIFKAGCSLQEPAGLGRISQRRNSVSRSCPGVSKTGAGGPFWPGFLKGSVRGLSGSA
jgi:hypothetical protein